MGLVLTLAAVKLLLHLLTSGGYGYFRDEFYYLACGERLDWGYVDHPPLVALIARVTRRTLGESLLAVRFLPAVAGALTVLVTGLMVRRLGGGRSAQVLACLAVIVDPIFLALNHILSMNAFELLFWALAAYVVVLILQTGRGRYWLLFGLVAGVGLLNKHSMLFFGFGLFVALLLTPARRWLLDRWLWLGGGLAVLIFLPNVIWEVRHGWPTLEFMRNAQQWKNVPFAPLEFLGQQVLLLNPLAAPLWLLGLTYLLFSRDGRPYRALGWTYVVILAVFLLQKAKPYYLAPAYPMLLAGGAVALEAFVERRGWSALKPAYLALLVASGAAIAPLALPVLPVGTFIAYNRALGLRAEAERHRLGKLPQFYADMFGWREMTAAVARVYEGLAPEEQAQSAVYAQNYGEAGALEFFGRAHGLPRIVSGHNSYFLWGPGDDPVEVVIVVGGRKEDHLMAFEEVTVAEVFRHEYVMPYENDLPIYVCRRPRMPLRELWPRTKRFI